MNENFITFPMILRLLCFPQQMVLTTGSYSMGLWQKLPDSVPLLMYVYFFNVTNSAEILKAKDDSSLKMPKPNLVQMGPYVYRWNPKELHVRTNKKFFGLKAGFGLKCNEYYITF